MPYTDAEAKASHKRAANNLRQKKHQQKRRRTAAHHLHTARSLLLSTQLQIHRALARAFFEASSNGRPAVE
jgi:hypothetical protein